MVCAWIFLINFVYFLVISLNFKEHLLLLCSFIKSLKYIGSSEASDTLVGKDVVLSIWRQPVRFSAGRVINFLGIEYSCPCNIQFHALILA